MIQNRLNVLFVLRKAKLNKKGECPLMCRLTYLGKRKMFSTRLFINPDRWNSKEQLSNPPDKESEYINTELSLIKQEINQAFLFLKVNKDGYDVEDIYLQYKGENVKEDKTIIEVFKEHNEKVKKLIGKEYVIATYWKFEQAKKLLSEFIQHNYRKNDFQFRDLEIKFIKDYEFYLRTDKNLAQTSIYKVIQRFKKMVKIAISQNYLDKDPFLLHKIKNPKTEIIYLDSDELKLLEEHQFSQNRLSYVRDLFVFCCYTGLSYKDLMSLNKENVFIGFDGSKWLNIYRNKTKKKYSIPLLPKAIEIIERYSLKDEKLFKEISNQRFNSYLKEIADIVGIEKKLRTHIARKTFATTVLLYNDVPMEIVSELLGHSSINTTQAHYGKVVQKSISEQMKSLSKKLNLGESKS